MIELRDINTSYDVLLLLQSMLKNNDGLDCDIDHNKEFGYIIVKNENDEEYITVKIKESRLGDVAIIDDNSNIYLALYDKVLNSIQECEYYDSKEKQIVID